MSESFNRRAGPGDKVEHDKHIYMRISFRWLGAILTVAMLEATPFPHGDAQPVRATAPSSCVTDSNYQRLAFWVGDWEVVDSTGAHYATERVRTVVGGCALTIEWNGRAGDRGLNLSGYDSKSGEWRQMYVSDQLFPTGAPVRRSDPSYRGPGIRFIPLSEPEASALTRTRVTVMPMSDHRVMQLFEDSSDGGKTWHVLFNAEHRPVRTAP